MGFPMLSHICLAALPRRSASVGVTIPILLAVFADVVDRLTPAAWRRVLLGAAGSCVFFFVHAMLTDPPAPALLALANELPVVLIGIVEQRQMAEHAHFVLYDVGILPPYNGITCVALDFVLRVSPGA